MVEEQRKPRQRRKEARPGEILEAAFEEFALNGFAGTRLDDVAARAGITKGTIYVYFPSKEALFVATFEAMARPTPPPVTPAGSAMAIIRAHFRLVYDHLVFDRRGRELLRIVMAEAGRFPGLAERWHDEVIAPVDAELRALVRYGIDRGEFRSVAVESLPPLMISAVVTASTWLTLFGDRRPLDVEAYLAAHLDMLEHALRAADA